MTKATDPRVAEIEFLSDLEHAVGGREYRVQVGIGEVQCGLAAPAFRDLVCDLLLDGSLNGPASVAWGASHASRKIGELPHQAIDDLIEQKPFDLRINHKGRLRLWRLRDELFSRRIRDKFDILLDQRYWERDLYVRMLDARADEPITLVQCDLDHFKSVNDSLGHDAGDTAIKTYFRLAQDVLGTFGDVYCRGGDEVLAILRATDLGAGTTLAEDLRTRVRAEFSSVQVFERAQVKPPTISVGVATFRRRVDPKEAARFVDTLQRKAKDNGRDRVEYGDYEQPTRDVK